jgi:hypothetical protein
MIYNANKSKARKLGAAFKKGYPPTYMKTQTAPIYRTSRAAQEKEILRLQATRGIPYGLAYGLIKKKYTNKKVPFKAVWSPK